MCKTDVFIHVAKTLLTSVIFLFLSHTWFIKGECNFSGKVYYLISVSYIILLKLFFYFSLLFSPLFLHLDIHPIFFFSWYFFCFALVGNSKHFWQASFISLIILTHSSYQSLFQLISALKDRFKRYILLVHALKAYRGIRGIAALYLNLSTGFRCVANFTSRCFTPGRNTSTHWIRRLNRLQSQCLLYFMMVWFFWLSMDI